MVIIKQLNFIKMKKLIVLLVVLFTTTVAFSQKIITKKVVNTSGNEVTIANVPKSLDEITSKWIKTGKVYNLSGTSYDVYVTATGKSYYVVLPQEEGYIKKKIN
jgi:ribosomal protein L21E